MTETDPEQLRRNVAQVRAQIAAAADRARRPADSVRLVAVTKSANRSQMEILVQAGIRDLAESRPQQLWERTAWFPTVDWHLVGHLQRNKVEKTIPLVRYIHSIDSERLLEQVYRQLQPGPPSVSLLLQVNISDEPAKHGWRPGDMQRVCESLAAYPGIPIGGLMGIASLAGTPDRVRREFRSLRLLSEQLGERGLLPDHCRELSMGMSGDFEMAIEEGATMVRIGSSLLDAEAR